MKKRLIALAAAVAGFSVGCGGGDTPDSSGTYQVYTTDGRHFAMTLNFTALTYSYAIDGGPVKTGGLLRSAETFSMKNPDPTSSEFYVANFSVAEGVIVGDIPIGSAKVPFIAVNSFVTQLSEIAGAKFEAMTLDTVRSSGASPMPVRWGMYRVNASNSTINYCKGTPTGVSAGAEPLSDPLACPAGTAVASFALSTTANAGVFTQTVVGAAGAYDNPAEVRFAKVAGNVYYLSAPASSTVSNAEFTIGMTGPQGNRAGVWRGGNSNLGLGVGAVFGPATDAVAFMGGSAAAPGSAAATGTVTDVLLSSNSLRYTPTGSAVATGGLVMSPALAVFGKLSASAGDMTLLLR